MADLRADESVSITLKMPESEFHLVFVVLEYSGESLANKVAADDTAASTRRSRRDF